MKRLLAVVVLLMVLVPSLFLPVVAKAEPCPVTYAFTTLPPTGISATAAVLNGQICMVFTSAESRPQGDGYHLFVFRYGTAPGSYSRTVNGELMSIQATETSICMMLNALVSDLQPCKQYYVQFTISPDFPIGSIPCPIISTGDTLTFMTAGCANRPPGQGSTGTGTSSVTSSPQPVQMSNIVVQSASLNSQKVSVGEKVDVAASVVNKGSANGEAKITLYVNGEEVESRGVTVSGGQTAPLHFYLSRNEPGTYSVYVGGVSAGSFTVDLFTNNDVLIYIIIALFTLGIAGALYMLTRKRAA